MPLFSRGQSDDNSPTPIREGDFKASEPVVARVAELMDLFNLAVGNDQLLRQTAKDLAATAGLRRPQDIVGRGGSAEDYTALLRRPWRMLESVTRKASADGDAFLAARIFGFAFFWFHQINPLMRSEDGLELLMDPKEPALTLLEIASAALGPLGHFPADAVIFSNQTGAMLAGDLARAAATTISDSHERGLAVSEAALTAAQEKLHGKQPEPPDGTRGLNSPAREAFALVRSMAENSFADSISDSEVCFPEMDSFAGFCVHPDGSLALVELGTEGFSDWQWAVQVTSGLALGVPHTPQLAEWVNDHNRTAILGKYYYIVDADGLVSVLYETMIWGGYLKILFEADQSPELTQLIGSRVRGEMVHIIQTGARERSEVVAKFGGRGFAPTPQDLMTLFVVSSG